MRRLVYCRLGLYISMVTNPRTLRLRVQTVLYSPNMEMPPLRNMKRELLKRFWPVMYPCIIVGTVQ